MAIDFDTVFLQRFLGGYPCGEGKGKKGKNEAWESRVQVSTLAEGDVRKLLVIAQGGRKAMAWMLTVDLVTHELRTADNFVSQVHGRHDPEAVARALRTVPAGADDLASWGVLPGAGQPTIAEHCWGVVTRSGTLNGNPSFLGLGGYAGIPYPTGMGKSMLVQRMMFEHLMENEGFDHPEAFATAFGYGDAEPEGRKGDAVEEGVNYLPDPDAPPCAGETLLRLAVEDGSRPVVKAMPGGASAGKAWQNPELFAPEIEGPIRAFLDAFVDRDATDILGRAGWSRAGYAFYAGKDDRALRRRQAAALYPALAPVLASRRAVGDLIDAARPFERALLDEMRLLLCQRSGATLTVAALRRMRELPLGMGFGDVRLCVRLAAGLPVDWVPTGDRGWRTLKAVAGEAYLGSVRLGLDLAPLVAHMRHCWQEPGPLPRKPAPPMPRYGGSEGAATLTEAMDMAERMVETLVRPCLLSMGAKPSHGRDAAFAGRILFAGKGFASVDAAQKRWHRGLPRLEAAMPVQDGVNAWPALFGPFTATGGYEITCLTNEVALKAEGADGVDAEGMRGLGHCVGGYGRKCYTGESHIASVRRTGKRGTVRVSTVELSVLKHPDDEGWLVEAVQHCARENDDPSPKAERAVAELVEALRMGRHAIDAGAAERRDDAEFDDVYDWTVPGAIEQAFEAWRPHMPRSLAKARPEGLRRLLKDIREGWGNDLRQVVVGPDGVRAFPRHDPVVAYDEATGLMSIDFEATGLDPRSVLG